MPAPAGSGRDRPARVAFLGNDAWSVPSLRALAGSIHDVVVVATAPPKPAGRGNHPTPTAVASAARELGLPLAEVDTVKRGDGFDLLAGARPEVLVVVAYGEILPRTVLELPAVAPVNLHFSLLPALRGASPVQSALRVGMDRTGVTTIVMDEGLDTGPVVMQREVVVEPEDDAGTLGARLAGVGAEILVDSVGLLCTEGFAPTPQDDALATYAPKLGPQDRALDWSQPAEALVALCRALSPAPAAQTSFRGDPLKVYRADAVDGGGPQGEIVAVTKAGIVVGTAAGGFRPLEVAPAGRRRMSGADLVNGLRPRVGERLG